MQILFFKNIRFIADRVLRNNDKTNVCRVVHSNYWPHPTTMARENLRDRPKLTHCVGKSDSGPLASRVTIPFLNLRFFFFILSVILFAMHFSDCYTRLVKCLRLRFVIIIVCNLSTTFRAIISSCIHFSVYSSPVHVRKPPEYIQSESFPMISTRRSSAASATACGSVFDRLVVFKSISALERFSNRPKSRRSARPYWPPSISPRDKLTPSSRVRKV